MKKKQRGGARPGAGRPKGEPTITLSYRIPEKHSQVINKYITNLIKKYKDEKTKPDTKATEKTDRDKYYNSICNILYGR